MDQQQTSRIPDTRKASLGQRNADTDSTIARVVPKRTTPPPQVAAFDSAM